MSLNHLIYYGNENLQKGIFNWSYDGTRNTSGNEVQAIPLARASGAEVVNTRRQAKQIGITGWNKVETSPTHLSNLMRDYDSIFTTESNNANHYLRVVREYTQVVPTLATTDWTATNDAVDLSQNTSKWQHPTARASLGFDIDVSNSGNDYATLTYSSSTQVDLSSHTDTGNFEFWVYIPDAYYVDSVGFKIGNDSSNYYAGTFTADYQGNVIHNGLNLFSIGWSADTYPRPKTRTAETGTVNDAQIDYCEIQINYSSEMEDVSGCYVDGIFWVDEDQVRNFPAYRTGEIKKTGEPHEITHQNITANFLNYTGHAESTHLWELFDEDDITTTTDTQVVELDGSLNASPRFTIDITDVTQIDSFTITDLADSQQIELLPGTLTASDQIVFGGLDYQSTLNNEPMDFQGTIPSFKLGTNRVQMNITGTSAVTLSEATGTYTGTDSECYYNHSAPPTISVKKAAQKFTATQTGSIDTLTIPLERVGGSPSADNVVASIYSDSSGSPGTWLGNMGSLSAYTSGVDDFVFNTGSVSVTNTTDYWILLTVTGDYGYYTDIRWEADNSTGTGAKYKIDSGSWTSITTHTFKYSLTITPTPSWDVDWAMEYKKLYAS